MNRKERTGKRILILAVMILLAVNVNAQALESTDLFIHIGANPDDQDRAAYELADAQIHVEIYETPDPDVYYCARRGRFLKDLDGVTPIIEGETTCTAAGLFWTGTKCCSEAEDYPGEHYNDFNGTGACWNSTGKRNGRPVAEEGNRVMPWNGEWYGCNIDANDEKLDPSKYFDHQTLAPLVQNNNTCDVFIADSGVNMVCGKLNDSWRVAPTSEQYIIKPVDPAMEVETDNPSECCGVASCWDGFSCVPNQRNDSTNTVHAKGFRCLEGQWELQASKRTWDRASTGYCPRETDCLVHPAGNFENNYNPDTYVPGISEEGPACIQDGQSLMQFRCEAGEWRSRTKLVAMQLLKFAADHSPTDYALFCDDYEEVLNFFDYEAIPNMGVVEAYIADECFMNNQRLPCVNQFCALKYKDNGYQLAFGVSLNTPVDSADHNFIETIGFNQNACSGVTVGSEPFTKCADKLWYSSKINSIIYAPTKSVTPQEFGPLMSGQRAQLEDPLQRVVDHFKARPTLQEQIGFMEETTLFDRLYVLRKPGAQPRSFYGYFGRDQYNNSYNLPESYIITEHKNFPGQDVGDAKWCDIIGNVLGINVRKDCQVQGNTLLLATHLRTQGDELKESWRDLTAKLRVK